MEPNLGPTVILTPVAGLHIVIPRSAASPSLASTHPVPLIGFGVNDVIGPHVEYFHNRIIRR